MKHFIYISVIIGILLGFNSVFNKSIKDYKKEKEALVNELDLANDQIKFLRGSAPYSCDATMTYDALGEYYNGLNWKRFYGTNVATYGLPENYTQVCVFRDYLDYLYPPYDSMTIWVWTTNSSIIYYDKVKDQIKENTIIDLKRTIEIRDR